MLRQVSTFSFVVLPSKYGMNFRSFLEMEEQPVEDQPNPLVKPNPGMKTPKRQPRPDKATMANQAEQMAKKLIATVNGGAYKDLADFSVMTYTNRECDSGSGDWVGQYSSGSIDSPRGAFVLLQIDRHKNVHEMTDTILHEMGHALWELLDKQAQASWNRNQKSHKWGAEEAFADDFMLLCSNHTHLMNNKELFIQITTVA